MRTKVRLPILVAVAALIATVSWVLQPGISVALPDYATKTGQSCSTCHVSPAGGEPLAAQGQVFAAIATHTTDPAGAWAQVTGAAQAPAPAGPAVLQATMDGSLLEGGSAVYSITLKNGSTSNAADLFVAGTIPSGSSLIGATATPAGGIFMGVQGDAAA